MARYTCASKRRELDEESEGTVQGIEVSDLGVRFAFMSRRRVDVALTFRLFPRIHVGERTFYAAVQQRLAACDVIFLEGVELRRARYLLLLARSVARNPRFGLVSQEDALDLRPLRAKPVRAISRPTSSTGSSGRYPGTSVWPWTCWRGRGRGISGASARAS